jgi:predicted nuclease of predicted toxin-antitoxin system
VKFLVDMPLPPALAVWLRGQGHDATHALELGLDRAPDTEIIARAVSEKRTVITADLDYPRLLALSGATAPSLVLFRGADWADNIVIERMNDILRSLSAKTSSKVFWWSSPTAFGADGCQSDERLAPMQATVALELTGPSRSVSRPKWHRTFALAASPTSSLDVAA